jgi:hypothetical protein
MIEIKEQNGELLANEMSEGKFLKLLSDIGVDSTAASESWKTLEESACYCCDKYGEGNENLLIGAFIPKAPSAFGALEGKSRFLFYRAHKKCLEVAGTLEALEKKMQYETNKSLWH